MEAVESVRQQPGDWQRRLRARDPSLHVHLIGIGGAGLGPIATVLLALGVQVSGSDRQANAATARLADRGAMIYADHSAARFADLPEAERPDVVLISSAVGAANPERAAAAALGIPVVKRNDFLPALLAGRRLIAVAGTHGKTTTTAMTVQVLRAGGIDCGYIIGADTPAFGSAAAGSAPEFVLEADEYDRMFLGLRPEIAVVTNVEWDHPDCYPTPASFRRAFMQFTDSVERDGQIISCADDPGAVQVHAYAPTRGPRWITYGLAESADLRAAFVKAIPGGGSEAEVHWWHAPAGTLRLEVAGVHNVRNALAAVAAGVACGMDIATALAALQAFRGSNRRFEWKGEGRGVTVIDDYAHHPTEIQATLAAARQRFPLQRIWAVFQPHTFSRTQRMLYRMGESFEQANEVIVLDIYAAREIDDGSVSAGELVASSPHPAIRHIPTIVQAARYLAEHVAAGDVVITLGAGDGNRVGELLLAQLGGTEAA